MSNTNTNIASSQPQMKQHMGLKASRTLANTLIYIMLISISIIWLIPFIFILLQSFRVESTHQVGYVLPQVWGFRNYVELFNSDFPRWYVNTFVAALATCVLQTIVVLCMSYTLSRFRFRPVSNRIHCLAVRSLVYRLCLSYADAVASRDLHNV